MCFVMVQITRPVTGILGDKVPGKTWHYCGFLSTFIIEEKGKFELRVIRNKQCNMFPHSWNSLCEGLPSAIPVIYPGWKLPVILRLRWKCMSPRMSGLCLPGQLPPSPTPLAQTPHAPASQPLQAAVALPPSGKFSLNSQTSFTA